jgi:hypothetical protein
VNTFEDVQIIVQAEYCLRKIGEAAVAPVEVIVVPDPTIVVSPAPID